MRRLLLAALALAIVLPLLAVTLALVVTAVVAGPNCGSGTPTVSTPLASTETAGEMVRYLESQGVSAFGAAGIVGNLEQESGLNPMEPGQGLAQWNPGWWAQLVSYDRSVGQNPDTVAGQLMYIASELHSADASLLARLNAATSPQEAAIEWQNDYEQCRGAGPHGTLSFDPAALCMTGRREGYAVAALQAAGGATATGSTQLVSFTPGQACNAAYALTGSIRGYTDPFAAAKGISWTRTDQGVDACMQAGSPLLAFAPSRYVQLVPDFYAGEPAMVLQILGGPLAGRDWYWSEQITPTISLRQTVSAGQTVATYAAAGSCIEIGWWAIDAGRPLGGVEGYREGYSTLSGADFRYLLQALGANPGTGADLSIPHPTTIGTSYYPPPP
ncbi:MAG: phage tail tip lysozyme [Solirubrobacteraceae bacterium]